MSIPPAVYICRSCVTSLKQSLHLAKSPYRIQHGGFRVRRLSSTRTPHFRLAIIGSGPAGFYAAGKVMKDVDNAMVDMYEHLPVPFGLVRYGVAPDHPEVKNCQDRFEEIASSENFDFIGNISVGYDVPLAYLKRHYDAILFAYGASKDKRLGISGEELEGVYSARAFVAWYNGLPGFSDLKPRIEDGSDAVIIGQGNVALDVARILLSDVNHLRKTDIPEYALEALSRSKIRSVHVVGRRGPLQAAFTIKELREIINIPNIRFAQVPRDLFPSDLSTLPRPRRRIAELLLKSGTPSQATFSAADKHFTLDFLLSPQSFNSSPTAPTRLNTITFEHNHYPMTTSLTSPSASVVPAPDTPPLHLPATAAFRSIGYKAAPLPGFADLGIPFDARSGTIPNLAGRVVVTDAPPTQADPDFPPGSAGRSGAGAASTAAAAQPLPGVYAAGWVKRGPTGVIASTMADAFETAEALSEDVRAGKRMLNDAVGGEQSTGLGWRGVEREMEERGAKKLRRTDWRDWKRIDEVERQRGATLGKEREKITSVEEMLGVLDR